MKGFIKHPFMSACGRVFWQATAGGRKTYLGTAYLVNGDVAVTCRHVTALVPPGALMGVDFGDIPAECSATLHSYDEEADTSVLRLAPPVEQVEPLSMAEGCDWKAPWDSYGFAQKVGFSGTPLSGTIEVPDGKSDDQKPAHILKSDQLEGKPPSAVSGSPVVVGGVVVGHIRRMALDAQKQRGRKTIVLRLAYATPSTKILPLLEGLGVVPRKGQRPRAGSQASDDIARAAIAVARRWNRGGLRNATDLIDTATDLIRLAQPAAALAVLKNAGDDLRAAQTRALALGKAGRTLEAIKLLEDLREGGHHDEETLGILGGRYKDQWLETQNKAFLRAAVGAYREAYEVTGKTYSGINAAALALQVGDRGEAARIAKEVLDKVRQMLDSLPHRKKAEHWDLATRAEAHLILGDLPSAKEWYSKAVERQPTAVENIARMRQQARLNLKALGLPVASVDDALPVPRIVAFTGHMTDAPDRPGAPRFPEKKVPDVRKAIRAWLAEHRVGFGFSSAARGADLLFLREVLSRKGEARVFLPFPRQDFKNTSVGYGWDAEFDDVASQAKVDVTVIARSVPSKGKQADAFLRCSRRVQREAIAFAKSLDEQPVLLAVWNGRPGEGAGGTADAVREWRRAIGEPEVIDISKL